MKLNIAKQRKQSLISIVDDEACVRESLSSLVRSVGYRVEEFPSAESFLLDGKWDETACLILDVRLQGMGGLELQRRLVEMGREHPPIVFISGHATEKDQAWAATAGAVAFLRKPFGDEALLNAVRDAVARVRGESGPTVCFSFFGCPEALTVNNHANGGTRQKV